MSFLIKDVSKEGVEARVLLIETSSGYRPAQASDFGGSVSISGATVNVDQIELDGGFIGGITSGVSVNGGVIGITGTVNTVSSSESTLGTAVVTAISGSTVASTILTSGDYSAFTFYNDSPSRCFLKYGTNASPTDFTASLYSGDMYATSKGEYVGNLSCVWEANGYSGYLTKVSA